MSKLKSGAKSLFTIAMNAAKGVDQSVPEEVKKHRMDLCNSCPNKLITGNCKLCGCFVSAKTSYRQEACPDGKWGKWEPNVT